MAFDGKAFGREVVEIVKTYLREQLQPLEERVKQLEAEAGIAKAAKPVVRIRAGRQQ
ncbi:hypothetical protein [Rhizobium sullae]|uniref:hypothetical protein n=1 Tax=Rhizobium sullae TaxID=50338 RepID=UPI0018E1F84F|nr:hypothetical protein [Rhizobium sullae]